MSPPRVHVLWWLLIVTWPLEDVLCVYDWTPFSSPISFSLFFFFLLDLKYVVTTSGTIFVRLSWRFVEKGSCRCRVHVSQAFEWLSCCFFEAVNIV